MIDAADGLGIAPAGAAIGGNFKHGPTGLGPLRPAAQPPGSPAAAEADSRQEYAKHLYNHKKY